MRIIKGQEINPTVFSVLKAPLDLTLFLLLFGKF